MKTSIIEVGGLLSVLSTRAVEKRLARLPGVVRAEVNWVAGSTTVKYDEAVTSLRDIKSKLEKCGHHCRDELVPRHICMPTSRSNRRAWLASLRSICVALSHEGGRN
ncbi:heavy-metal-associated domain-containing protein (plasmid) [Cupriavidus necator]|uniref:Heavy-metal-associated domain-containing protein n=1 Tax=Cupriavidus necator TaxID=106590 RepID=A0A367PK97_CUPNE|nr:heavy metal-associated domain-containing protein [Cupriavidus necator]QQX89838.1 heavy-metal-associated domain-containing protein [Cupriavidus necator]RCJ08332.1 heavy-metal-associated domain-containing protein [Cupriavidus necator]